MKHLQKQLRQQKTNLNIVVTGGSRGLGKSLSEHFARQKDKVYVLSRTPLTTDHPNIKNIKCDIGVQDNIKKAIKEIPTDIDIWINNAGMSGGARSIMDLQVDTIENIVKTNLIGTSLSCKLAHEIMINQPQGGAIFNVAGAGSNGMATPDYAIYGSTKAAIVQLTKSLQKEWKNTNVDLHVISPGMMITELLLDNMSVNTFEMIEFVCTHPDEVAAYLGPRIKQAYYHKNNAYIRFLTLFTILSKYMKNKLS